MELARETPVNARTIESAFRFPKNLPLRWERNPEQTHSTQPRSEPSPALKYWLGRFDGYQFSPVPLNHRTCRRRSGRRASRCALLFHDEPSAG